MRNSLSIFALLVFFYILQTSLIPAAFMLLAGITHLDFLAGATVQLVLILLTYLSLNRDFSGTLIWAILFGIVGNWFGLAWNGAYASGLFAAAFVCASMKKNVLLKDSLSIALFVAAISLVEAVTHLGIGHLLHQIPAPLKNRILETVLSILTNALAAPAVFALLGPLDRWSGGAAVRSRRTMLYDM